MYPNLAEQERVASLHMPPSEVPKIKTQHSHSHESGNGASSPGVSIKAQLGVGLVEIAFAKVYCMHKRRYLQLP